jgi:hypothetical protein
MADCRPIVGSSVQQEISNSDSLLCGQALVFTEQASAPATPTSGYGILYVKTDGLLYFKNDSGTEYLLS